MLRVIDNFFSDPYRVRNMGLKGEYYSSDDNRWPGYRWHPPEQFRKFYLDKVSNILDEELNLTSGNFSFQYIDKSWLDGLCHTDHPPFKYTCITFLNPKPLSNSGTEVYRYTSAEVYLENPPYNIPEKLKRGTHKEDYYRSSRNIIDRWIFNKFKKKYNSFWHDPCIISNRFNRTLIFDSALYHRAQNFFGNNVKDSRLTLIGFFM